MSDVIGAIRARPMGRFQLVVIGLCVALNMLDGFDVMAMSFAAPSVRAAWTLPPTELGILLSAGIAGTTVGLLLISPFADHFGRRPIILLCTLDIVLGMLLSAAAQDFVQLALLRFVTGLGLGGILANLATLVSEYASAKRRDFAVSLIVVGYAAGALIGGFISVFLVGAFGWRAVFIFGSIVAAVLLPVAMVLLPESIEFLLLKRPKNALERLNAILERLRQPHEDVLPAAPAVAAAPKVPMAELFSPRYLRSTLLICAAFFIVLLNNYFLLSWTPTLLVDFGMSVEGGISGSLLMHIGAIAGGLAIGAFTASLPMRVWSAVFMVILFVTVMLFATLPGPLWLLLAISVAIGFFGNGAATSLYPIVTEIYPAHLRASGTGLAIGMGRLGAIISPYIAGVLMGAGWPKPAYCFVLCVPLLLAAGLVLAIRHGTVLGAAAAREAKPELVPEISP